MTEQNEKTLDNDRRSLEVFLDCYKDTLIKILSRHHLELLSLRERLDMLEQKQIVEDDMLDVVQEEVKNQLPDAIQYELMVSLSDVVKEQLPDDIQEIVREIVREMIRDNDIVVNLDVM